MKVATFGLLFHVNNTLRKPAVKNTSIGFAVVRIG